jgi:hypothetical protein
MGLKSLENCGRSFHLSDLTGVWPLQTYSRYDWWSSRKEGGGSRGPMITAPDRQHPIQIFIIWFRGSGINKGVAEPSDCACANQPPPA